MDLQITSLKQNLDLIELSGRRIYLVGTAHISEKSAELVEETIREYEPDTICIELCEPRFESLQNPNRWRETDLFEVIKTGKAYVLMAQLALSSFQKRLANEFGIRPGEEMRRAMELAEETGASISLIDREVRTTLKRAWAKASLWTGVKMFWSLFLSLFTKEEVSAEEIEELKSGDMLSALMSEFSAYFPGLKTALIDERDLYMAQKLKDGPGETVVAVVGAGHVPGMKKAFAASVDLSTLELLPPARLSVKLLGWGIPALIIGMIVFGFFQSGAQTSFEMIWAWVLINGSFAALGTLLVLAHPLTILTAFVAAPITSLNPTIAAGWVCGLVEVFLRKPRVRDLETIAEDALSLRGLINNRVSRVLLVIAFANIGSMFGTFIGAGKIASLL